MFFYLVWYTEYMLDANIVIFFHGLGISAPAWRKLVVFLNYILPVVLAGVTISVWWHLQKRRRFNALLLLVLILSVSYLVNRFFGALYFRARPFVTIGFIPFVSPPSVLKSFPSEHATLAAAGAVWLWKFGHKKSAIWGGFLAFCIGILRVFVGVHYPSDVIAGWVLGMVISALTLKIWKRYIL